MLCVGQDTRDNKGTDKGTLSPRNCLPTHWRVCPRRKTEKHKFVSHLRFADDIVILAESLQGFQRMLDGLVHRPSDEPFTLGKPCNSAGLGGDLVNCVESSRRHFFPQRLRTSL